MLQSELARVTAREQRLRVAATSAINNQGTSSAPGTPGAPAIAELLMGSADGSDFEAELNRISTIGSNAVASNQDNKAIEDALQESKAIEEQLRLKVCFGFETLDKSCSKVYNC